MSNEALPNRHALALSLHWRKATFSGVDNCVEVADLGDQGIGIRDSKNPVEGSLVLSSAVFSRWIDDIKHGEFDKLVEQSNN